MKSLTGALFLLGTASAIVLACGDSKPEAKSPDSPVSSSSAADMPPEAPKTVASAPPASTPPPAEDAGAAPKSANGAPIGEPKDECTPVGVDFEKRARPKLKECYAAGKKKENNPNLEGTVKIKIK